MKQAIDEGFILDVLENYTCFGSYFRLVKTIQDDPKYKLAPAVDRWQALHDTPKCEFKALLRKFLRSYSFITQMISLGDARLRVWRVAWIELRGWRIVCGAER